MDADIPYGQGTRMLTIDEMCEWFRVPVGTVRGWVRRESIPYHKIARTLRFSEQEVLEHSIQTRPGRRRPVPREMSLVPVIKGGPRPPAVKLKATYDPT